MGTKKTFYSPSKIVRIYQVRRHANGSILEVKYGPMYKDQGVGMVVNNLLYLSLGYQMVFKVVRLKRREQIVVSLTAILSQALHDKTKGRLRYIKYKVVELHCIFLSLFLSSALYV